MIPDLSVGTVFIPAGGVDAQSPHAEDEIHVREEHRFEVWHCWSCSAPAYSLRAAGP